MSIQKTWQIGIAFVSLITIGIYFILKLFDFSYAQYPLIFVVFTTGVPLLLQILFKLVKGNYGADFLAGLALITGMMLHEYLASVIIILMLTSGQILERYASRKASSVLLALEKRMPAVAHRRVNLKIEDIPLEALKIEDEVIVYPHETCPVDGFVLEGHGSMDESYLTGEPYQISKAPGALVFSGALNGDSLLIVKAIKSTKNSRYASIVKVLGEAEQKRPSIRRIGDTLGALFGFAALIFAFLTWYLSGDATRFLAVLVIATPCPLLIAIPITIISAISKAAKRSIIIKDPTVLEQIPICKTAIFDKTGTLTYGRPRLTEINLLSTHTKEFILQNAASLECYSKHPLSFAVLNAAKKENIVLLETSNVSEVPGQGLQGVINHHKIHITGRKKLLNNKPELHALLPKEKSGLECVLLIDDEIAATLHFHDSARPETESFINHLMPAHHFNNIMIVSGDRESEVNYLGRQLNINKVYASQSPEQKLDIVRKEVKKAPTIFMGDGINDAPALTAATVGIAFGEFSNVTAAAASAVIMENTFNKVDELFHLCLQTRKIILQSAVGGIMLSIIGMGFAAIGYIPPITGALIQEFIDVLAIINALRLSWNTNIKIDLTTVNR